MRRIALIALAVATALAVAAAAFGATILNNPTHKFNLAYSKKALVATAGSVTLKSKNTSAVLKHNIALRKGTKATSKLLVKGKVVGKGGVSKVTTEARQGEVPLLLHRPWSREGRHVGDPHGQVIGAVGPVAALAALVLVATAPTPTVDRVDEQAAWSRLVRQVRLGPRPAGSPASRKLAAQLKAELPNGRFQAVPGGLRNVVGFVPGRDPSRTVVVGAHYDTKDLPGFVGANDGAGGTALVVELARSIKPKELRPSVVFILFDGEESPDDQHDFLRDRPARQQGGCAPLQERRGDDPARLRRRSRSLAAARGLLGPGSLAAARAAARRVGTAAVFPPGTQSRSPTTTSLSSTSACPRSISSTSTTRAGTGRATTSRACRSAVSTRWARPCTSSYEASSSSSTRRWMSSRITRTSSIGSPIGSRSSQST